MELNQETLQFITLHREEDPRTLALRAKKNASVDLPMALTQIAGRQTARLKLPSWGAVDGILYPRHLSMEQCSSEMTARYKASLVEGETLTDLTGGFGVDCFFLSQKFQKTHYVERQEELCEIAAHNFPLLGSDSISIHPSDGVCYLESMEPVDWIFLDPARRNEHGGKTVAIEDCEPNLKEIEPLLLQKSVKTLVKLSPMLDIALALRSLTSVQAVHVVSVRNECKELLLELHREKTAPGEVQLHCVNLTPEASTHFVFTPHEENEAECPYTDQPEEYLYEPNASLLKAGGYRIVAQRYGLKKLHPNSHLYTGSELITDFPGRRFRIEQKVGFGKKELKALCSLKQANITVRNFPCGVNELRKKLKLSEGGDTYLFATTLSNEEHCILRCRK